MRRLVPPYKPLEPKPPETFISYEEEFVIHDGEELSLGDIADRLPPEVQISDLKFRGVYLDDYENVLNIVYQIKKHNPYYNSEMDKYNSEMEKYPAKLAKYKDKYKGYLENKKACDVEASEKSISNKEKEIAKLKKRLKDLEK